jgi:hypothetical protein
MRIDLTLSGANDIRNSFKGMSSDLDVLNRKLDATQAKLNGMGAGPGGPTVATATASGGSVPPVASPPVLPSVAKTPSKSFTGVAVGSSGPTQARNVANAFLNVLPAGVKIAVEALAVLALASYEAAKAAREYADFGFIARGGREQGNQLAGISRAAGVGLGEAGQLAGSRPGGAAQLNAEIEQLRNIVSDEAASQYARNRGIEGYRSVRNLTDRQYEDAKNQPQIGKGSEVLADRAMAQLNIELGRFATIAETIAVPVFTMMVAQISSIADLIATDVEGSPLYKGIQALTNLFNTGTNSAADKMDNAADKFRDSVNKIQDATFGGGPRTRGAIPAAWGWATNNGATANQIHGLGGIL